MSSQTFIKNVPNNLIFDLLDQICLKTNEYYVVNNNSYKKGMYLERIAPFVTDCKPYYCKSKMIYLERTLTYNRFMTILRQICKYNKLKYTSHIKYSKTEYDIEYFLYFA
jgi:hypothetical protein